MTSASPRADAVSVVIPSRNGERFLGAAIASAQAQTHPPEEVIVVDDGSTDSTRELALDAGARLVANPSRGVAAARNAGIAVAQAPLIALLDHDDLWLPEKLERQVARLASNPRVGFVTARARVRLEPGVELPPSLNPGDTGISMLVSSLLVRATTLRDVGGFDPAYAHANDYDWFLRARDDGVASEELEELLVEFRIHGANASYERAAIDAELMSVLRASIKRRAAGRASA